MSTPYTFAVPLSELADITSRFNPDLKMNHIYIVGSSVNFTQHDMKNEFAVSKAVNISSGDADGCYAVEYNLSYLARWVAQAMELKKSLFSPMRMMVEISITDALLSFKLNGYDHAPLSFTYRDASPEGFFHASYLEIFGSYTKTIPSATTIIPMHLVMPYVNYRENVSRPLPMGLFSYEGHPEMTGFAIDGVVGIFRAKG